MTAQGDVGVVALIFNHCPLYRTCVLMSLEQSKLEVHFHVVQQETLPEVAPNCPESPRELFCQGE